MAALSTTLASIARPLSIAAARASGSRAFLARAAPRLSSWNGSTMTCGSSSFSLAASRRGGSFRAAHAAFSTSASATLYDQLDDWSQETLKIDGETAVGATVEAFYVKVLADPELAPFFAGLPMETLYGHQKRFITSVVKGTAQDAAKYMKKAHAKQIQEQGLNEDHFDLVAGHLVSTLGDLNVPQGIVDGIVAEVVPLRGVFKKN